MYFNKTQKESIEKKIKEVEQKSSAELVAVITKKSDGYEYVGLLISLLFTVILTGYLLVVFSGLREEYILLTQVTVIVSLSLLFTYKSKLLMCLLPKSYKYNISSKYANTNFATLGLNNTQTKQAIMFFVSVEEKYVEIITDSNIKEKIPDSKWQDIVDVFIEDVKKENIYLGYSKAIDSCSSILIENFPVKQNDVNELEDEIIELKI